MAVLGRGQPPSDELFFMDLAGSTGGTYTESVDEQSSNSKAGHPLGTLINFFSIQINPRFRALPRAWVMDSYRPFWDRHARWRKYFFYAWDLDVFPEHVFWVRHAGRYATPLSIVTRVDSLDLDLKGVRS